MFDGGMEIIQIIFTMIIFFIVHGNVSFIKLTILQYCFSCGIVGVVYVALTLFSTNIAPLSLYIVPIIFMYIKIKKFAPSFISHTLICLIVFFVDGIVSHLLLLLFGKKYFTTEYGVIFILSIITIVSAYISKFVFVISNKYKGTILNNYKSKYLQRIYILLSIIFVTLFITLNFNRNSDIILLTESNSSVIIIWGTMLILILYILFIVARKEAKIQYKERELENLKGYTKNLEMMYTDMRKFRHDYINIIASIAGFIEERDIDGLAEHFSKNIYPLNSKMNNNNYRLGLLKNIELPEIKGLISSKIIHAQELGIEVGIDILETIDDIKMDTIDFTRCMGIILDNAVEASIESEKKILNIAFINKNKSLIVVVENTFPLNIPPIYKMFKYGFSTKGDNRGIGLSNLREITNKYQKVSLETVIKEDKFVQNLIICDE
ncbi:GHKL domain-containing protein [uncultured Clostridium sp.]|uniref:sensor histidine kinase n=1 Tax=uncultured Clostridium sp. TaxID=59620 RepID=UPI0025FED7AB|nr:GHKL domain-containing protein [uncultured Clostridium sp.]